MLREKLKSSKGESKSGFRYRGLNNTRIEALSDSVFAIAIALMLISSSIPETYNELLIFLEDFVPFAITITLLMLIWFEHFQFFLRYGITNGKIVFLNTILLFLILFYVYPLKFLFKILYTIFAGIFTGNTSLIEELFQSSIQPEQTGNLMVIYGLGAASIFFVLTLMYGYAGKISDELELSALEKFETNDSIFYNLASTIIPLISVLTAVIIPGRLGFTLSGFTYFLFPPTMIIFSILRNKRKAKLFGKA